MPGAEHLRDSQVLVDLLKAIFVGFEGLQSLCVLLTLTVDSVGIVDGRWDPESTVLPWYCIAASS